MKPYETLESKQVFQGKIINVVQDTISLPNGKTTLRETIIHGGAAAILPVDNDGNIIFVRQYRHAAGEMMLEIPAGTLEKGEDPLVCAQRELEEETGYKGNKFTFVTAMYSAVGFCSEILHIYLAEDLVKGIENPDEDEFVTVERYTLEQSLDKVFRNEIKDSKSIVAILAYQTMKNMGKV